MNYTRIHNEIIEFAKARTMHLDHVEKHHILPVSLGGDNSPANLVLLTPREHFLIHKLLIKLNTGISRRKMVNAFCYMAFTKHNRCLKRPISSRDYQYARRICKDGMYTKERNAKISKSRKALFDAGFTSVRSEETKTKHRNTLAKKKEQGIEMSELQKNAISKGLIGNRNGYGHEVTHSHRQKIAEALAKTFLIRDPNGFVFEISNLSAWLRSKNSKTKKIGQEYKKGVLKGYTIFTSPS